MGARAVIGRVIDWITGRSEREAFLEAVRLTAESFAGRMATQASVFQLTIEAMQVGMTKALEAQHRQHREEIAFHTNTFTETIAAFRDSALAQQQTLQSQQQMLEQFLRVFQAEGASEPRIMDERAETEAELRRMEAAGYPVGGSEAEKFMFLARHMDELNG